MENGTKKKEKEELCKKRNFLIFLDGSFEDINVYSFENNEIGKVKNTHVSTCITKGLE